MSDSQAMQTAPPVGELRGCISHYWLSRDNCHDTHAVLPDGAVDVVFALGRSGLQTTVYGTTTARTDLMLEPDAHYLGIRFRPGQSRWFLEVSAAELRDRCVPTDGLWPGWTTEVAAAVMANGDWAALDRMLFSLRSCRYRAGARIDQVIEHMGALHGRVRISDLGTMAGVGQRQFERQFIDSVGVPPKQYAEILRFRRALTLVTRTTTPLAHIAADMGYADQSHLTRQFARLAGLSPARARRHVGFVQDDPGGNQNNQVSINP